MERNLLVGNGINIQFGGIDVYSGSATMDRVVKNIKAGKYTGLTENSLSVDEQYELLDKMVKIIDQIKAGKYRNRADGLFMLMDLDRIKRTYPDSSSITSVFLEDYFLAFEIFNNGFKNQDGEEQNELYRKIIFALLHQIIVDGIYNDCLLYTSADEIDRLRELKQKALTESAEREGLKKRIAEMREFLNSQPTEVLEYDEQLVRRLIEKVTVYDERFEVEFKSGMTVDVER